MDRPASKRQKVLIACEPCRTRKAKCDGIGPVCGPCQNRARKTKIQCEWSVSAPSSDSEHQIQALRDRIAFLESRQLQDSSDQLPVLETPYNVSRPHAPSSGRGDESNEIDTGSLSTRAVSQTNHHFSEQGLTEIQQTGDGIFEGASSSTTFMQNVNAIVEQRLQGNRSERWHFLQPSRNGVYDLTLANSRSSKPGPADLSLPLRKTADELMHVYWRDIHPFSPILDREQTTQQYESLWTGKNDSDQTSFLCLINAMFALACQLNSVIPPQERAHTSSIYHSRAMDLLDVWGTPSLRQVQSVILLATCCHSNDMSHQCWMLVGVAIRISQALGLHLPGTSERSPDERSRQLLRTVWHGCIHLDRTVSMTYGRPCGSGERLAKAVPLPSSVSSDGRMVEVSSTLKYFNLAVTLQNNLHEILYSLSAPGVVQVQSVDELYDRYFRHAPTDLSQPSVMDIEGALQRWHSSIPADLKASAFQSVSEETALRRQAVMLEQHYLHVRLLLLRPFLSAILALDWNTNSENTSTVTTPLSVNISIQCASACVRVAQETVNIVHIHRSRSVAMVGNTAPWWLNVLFLYTAATVLNAALLSQRLVEELSEASILDSWQQALAILEEYTAYGTHVKRLVITLRVLFDTVPKQYSQHKRWRQQNRSAEQHASPLIPASEPSEIHHTGMYNTQGSGAPFTPQSSNSAQIPSMAHSFDLNPSTAGLWELGFDPLDLAWLTSLPSDIAM